MANVVAICGSLRTGSFTKLALDVAVGSARQLGVTVQVVDLASTPLPFYDGSPGNEAVARFKQEVAACEALLVATPVYHESYSGSLKNALDHLYGELSEKVAGLIAVGGGSYGMGQALEHLRAVLRETSTWVLPRQVVVGKSEEAFEPDGKLKSAETSARLVRLGQEVVLRARQLRVKRAAAPQP
jgi:NAD(P)H-dependent FMN reductase